MLFSPNNGTSVSLSLSVFGHLNSEFSKSLPVLSDLGHVRCRAPLSGLECMLCEECHHKDRGRMFAWLSHIELKSVLLMRTDAVSIDHCVKTFPDHCLAFKYKQLCYVLAYKVHSDMFQVLSIFIFISVTFGPVTLACGETCCISLFPFNDLVIALCTVIEMTAMHYYTHLMV